MSVGKEQLACSAVALPHPPIPPLPAVPAAKNKELFSCGNLAWREDNFHIFGGQVKGACFRSGFALPGPCSLAAGTGGLVPSAPESRSTERAARPSPARSQPPVPAARGRLSVPGRRGSLAHAPLFAEPRFNQLAALGLGFLFFPPFAAAGSF